MTRDPAAEQNLRAAAELEPTAHVDDGPDEYRVEVEAPGLGERDLEVQVVDRVVRVSGPDLRKPGSDSTFEFLLPLPESADAGRVHAIFTGGVLVISAPKLHGVPRPVEIDDGSR
ncbi:MAG TPA: Hsp20 family protein [Gaiellaceae bacterium]|nr:Hsp20 family protein [Gaiellaceae bacterium]